VNKKCVTGGTLLSLHKKFLEDVTHVPIKHLSTFLTIARVMMMHRHQNFVIKILCLIILLT